MTILICQQTYQAMIAHLRTVYPEEGCGFLGEDEGRLCRHFPIENDLHSPTVYQMNPQQQLNALLQLEDNPFAIYHSHPNSPATPSPTDIRQATYPDSPYLIASFQHIYQPTLHAYTIKNGTITEHPIVFV